MCHMTNVVKVYLAFIESYVTFNFVQFLQKGGRERKSYSNGLIKIDKGVG